MKNTTQITEKQSLQFTDGTIRVVKPITALIKPSTIPGLKPLKGNLDRQMIVLMDWFDNYRLNHIVTATEISAAESVVAQTLAKRIGGMAGTLDDNGQYVVYVPKQNGPYIVFINKLVDKVICDTEVKQTAVSVTPVKVN